MSGWTVNDGVRRGEPDSVMVTLSESAWDWDVSIGKNAVKATALG